MKDDETVNNCDLSPPHERRIHLADGRYMIFFEFGKNEAESQAATDEAEPVIRDNV